MGYRFCFGASGSGKSRMLHRMLLEKAQDALREPGQEHDNFVILVPDQYSVETQKEIVDESPCKGILNIDVLSFGRLTHKIFEEIGVPERAALDEMGKTLLIRRAAGACESSLGVLKKSIRYPGMIAQIKSVLSEFMQYGISEEELVRIRDLAERSGQGALSARLSDLSVLYHAFAEMKRDKFITSEETLDLLAEAIPMSEWVRRSTFVLDGFTGFTPVQYRVLTALIRCGREVIIALTYGKDDDGNNGGRVCASGSPGREDALFYLSRKTVCDIDRYAAREGLVRGDDLWTSGDGTVPYRFRGNPVLAHLESNIFRYPARALQTPPDGRIRLFETDTPQEEVRQICIGIRRLTLTKGYKYRDISVVCGDLERYGALFEELAPRYGIPFYIDVRAAAGLSPLTEAIRSVLEIRPQGYSYNAVFRYLRSGMSSLTREETDLLENYCLAHGIRGRKKWARSFDAETEPLRQRFLSEIEPVAGSIDLERSTPATAAERTEALYRFMTGLSMEEKLQEQSEAFKEAGDYVRAMQLSQLYRYVIGLLEEIHDLMGVEQISAADYLSLLEAGLTEIRLGTLPGQADRVLIGDIERTRLSECRVLFLAGVNDGNIPRGTSHGGILSDLDREFLQAALADSGTELSPAPRRQMCLQRLYLYMNMTKPSDILCLSFARTTPDGTSLRPSYLIRTMQKMFPGAEVEHPQLLPVLEQLTGEPDSVVWLSGALGEYAQGRAAGAAEEADAVKTAYGYLMRNGSEDTRRMLGKLTDAAFMRYEPGRISERTAKALYGQTIMGGISRMETAAQCQLRQFLQYGLGLVKRKEYVIEPADTGTILHQSLDRFSHKLRARGLSWESFTREEGHAMISEALRETVSSYKELLMYATVRSESQIPRLERILYRSADVLQYQIRQGLFVPEGYEYTFGPDGEADTITFALSGGRSLRLTGRIDRLDLCREEESIYVKILDYKLGANDLDEDLIRRGIQLQLLIYMRAAMKDLAVKNPGKTIVPSAMLYYRIKDPVLTGAGPDSAAGEEDGAGQGADTQSAGDGTSGEEATLPKIRADLRPTGLVHADPSSYKRLDRFFTTKSDVIPVSLTKNGALTRTSHVYTSEEFEALAEQAAEAVRRLAEEILAGCADAAPAAWKSGSKDRTACDYCPYRNVCGFDPSIEGYEYRDK